MRDRQLRAWRALVRQRADAEWRQLSSDVVDELATHLADLHASARRDGASDADARQLAIDALSSASFLELSKRPRARRNGSGWVQDVRLALRQMRAAPVVTIVAVLSLALGIGANTAIFSLVNGLMLRALPVGDPGRLARVTSATTATSWTNPIWEQLRDRAGAFDGAAAWAGVRFDLAKGGEAQYVDGLWVSGRYFDTLGVRAILGRTLTPADDRRGGGPDGAVAVLGYGFWISRFGGSPDAIGRQITLDRVPFTIVGVAPPGFFGAEVGRSFDVAVPLGTEPLVNGAASELDVRLTWWLDMIVRLKPDQSIAAAEAALQGMQPQIREATLPGEERAERYLTDPFTLEPAATGLSALRDRYQRPLLTLFVVVALVLLVACANIANLQLARAAARRHEMSLRVALGASRWRLARQFLAESLVLSIAGAGCGLVFASWVSRVIVLQLSTPGARVSLDVGVDWRVLAFTTAVAVATVVLFGTAPALRASRAMPVDALKEQGRDGQTRTSVASSLVVIQVALSLVLVVAAGLFMRTFTLLASTHLGFDRDHVIVATVNAPRSYFAGTELPALHVRALAAVRGVPGVAHAALSSRIPLGVGRTTTTVGIPDGVALSARERNVHINYVSSDWFATFGTPLVAGRDFTAQEDRGQFPVVIVNETLARKFWNAGSPIGRVLTFEMEPRRPTKALTVIGVAADAVYRSLRDPIPPTLYMSNTYRERGVSTTRISVRIARGDPGAIAKSVAAAIASVDPNFVLTFRPLAEQVDAALVQERLVALLAGFFGVLALLLAALGLYGVTSYTVARRRTEIGIRIALGAGRAGVIGLVLSRVLVLVGAGVVVGMTISLWAGTFVASLLYGLAPHDPLTLAGAAAILAIVGGIAGWLPASRAARIDPMEILRDA